MKLTKFLLELSRLKNMPRTGWLFCNVPLPEVEDVAQHSFEVATVTMFLADELAKAGEKVNRERAIRIALIHDWAETKVADFPYTAMKYLKPAEAKQLMELEALRELLKGLSEGEEYLKLWEEYREKKTIESKLVHAADYLSILIQAVKYSERGVKSRELGELWEAVLKDLEPYVEEFKIVAQIANELKFFFAAPVK
ncbi:MAG: HD domain-containing protein [Candidatus Hadarchaeum sp.]|uniref:HD domain-containing protein n=1 Tax=Candidatus Hadarchaeum sp. TaxID=2883567 RepID=UPI003D0F0753